MIRLRKTRILFNCVSGINNKTFQNNFKKDFKMSDMINKRNIRDIMPSELLGKLRSKADFHVYLDKHRTYQHFSFLPHCSLILSPTGHSSKQGLPQVDFHKWEEAHEKEGSRLHPCLTLPGTLSQEPLDWIERRCYFQYLFLRCLPKWQRTMSNLLLWYTQHHLPWIP